MAEYTSGSLVDRMRDENPHLTKDQAQAAMNNTISAIKALVDQGEKVIIRGFGTFAMKHVPSRNGRNPRTGETLVTAAHDKLSFKPAKNAA
jgi:nucleoid DNA-binding protein